MKKIVLLVVIFLLSVAAFPQERRTIGYDGILTGTGMVIKNASVKLAVSIISGTENGTIAYKEIQATNTDSTAMYHLEIGNGVPVQGQFDSIIWSDGVYYLKIEPDSLPLNNKSITQNMLLRIPPDLNNDYEQGTIASSEFPDHGIWQFRNTRNRRPKLVTVDLTTSYANLAYPANTYPIYRHYEWCDPDRDGIGNSFSISYSENTNNYFRENTNLLGDVRLYAKPFQQVIISSTTAEISVTITKPIPLTNHSETYAIKGPWKFIYYIEW